MNNLPIILASGSPRRQELLKQIGIDFVGLSSNVSEEIEDGILPSDAVNILAERKAQAITLANPDSLVIGADTVIALGNEILGKPHTVAKAREMLKKMSGRTHQVITGVCLKCLNKNVNEVFNVVTDVTFNQLSEDLIDRYIKTGEPLDKSGSYAIQEKMGPVLVKSINGSYSNIVGLPLYEVVTILRELVNKKT